MFLTPAELEELTRRTRPSDQRRVLDLLEIPYRVHPVDRTPIVATAAVRAWSGAQSGAPAPAVYDVDVEGIRQHGKASATH